ncbi:BnaA02g12740D [Brassica napus]|uniref:non-specific serine/threonine protein kinase n=1 Tax=Brassica napus TaxID=3708 RepID=A0A078FHG1_BRANA|nr:BnaA02g12740D [Brassica napus]
MNTRAIIRFSKPTFYQVIFCIFSLLYYLPCASSQEELGWCGDMFQCGNITAGFPFWGGKRPDYCGHTLLELHCNNNNNTSLNISDQEYSVLDVDQTYTLTLARTDMLGSFCSAKFQNTTLPPDIFDLSLNAKNLTVSYLCDPRNPYLSSNFTCPLKGIGSVSLKPETQSSCNESFAVNVPMNFFPEEREFNLNQLESVLRGGFEVKVEIDEITCQECSSSGGICSFSGTTQVCCKTNSTSGITCEPKPQPSAADLYHRCSTRFICGDQVGLLYPFWIPGREECGHPDFKLTCDRGFAEINIASVKFRILEANYTTRIIRLARSDYIGHLCPQDPTNAPFNENILQFSPNTDLLTLYYDCRDFSFSTPAYDPTYFRELGCDDELGRSYYVTRNLSSPLLDGVRDLLNILKVHGLTIVSIPASGPALSTLQRFQTSDNIKKALEEGFELGVNQECSMCMDSGGGCGYNQTTRGFVCYCNNGPHSRTCSSGKPHGTITKILIGLSVLVAGVLVLLLILIPILRKRKASHDNRKQNLNTLIPLKHYSYAQVKRITNSFAEVVGEGGFGTVYRGSLSDGSMVAVKVLKDTKCNGEDFVNEVVSISRTSHVNIVSLLGFCSEGSKRAIVYELLENGSLDRFISTNNSMGMDWMAMHGIALGVARGLEYLHYGCKTRIVHFDIKPQNVLLDEDLCPKVSDFGLAKLCKKKESTMSLLDMRGTIGYIAPEMISRVYGSVSHKSDVYSYGMLVLEMIGARNKTSAENYASDTSSMYFPEWIYKDLEKGDDERLVGNGISNDEEEIAKKMTLVGLWCIQSSPSDRPPMNRVVEMMEGNLDSLEVPPKPVWQIPTVPLPETSWISEESSSITN